MSSSGKPAAEDPEANGILASLPQAERRRLSRALVPFPLGAHDVLHAPGGPIDHVYFPRRGCLVSLVLRLADDDRTCEAGLVGYEGVVGAEAFLGAEAAQFTAVVLAAGGSSRMEAGAFRAEARRGGALAALLGRYVQFLLLQFSQMAGCTRFHPLEQHFCSLLLRLRDAGCRDDLEITHERFARLLGVRRVGVTQAARKLQRAGLIRYRWGRLTILDRQGLDARACACHRQIRQAGQRLLPFAPPDPCR